ncbi:3-oxoacyl-[acyl-carrier-protein] reductase, chloroplastic [Heracleum sosnowskyi]|uniref:3-oxoacyl-[acyl-carrier-protein] reductase, chloroplastic n=1 Tax=Heracleum sosnowskyi TaxID=360622 RepID=A0AAD8IAG5_9APIA|nr:3-oxoacyl-[acyl-carrier-protein] reductase, chloroplastic [Heracleum sosnowskyi]
MTHLHSKVSDKLEAWSDLNGKVVLITGASSGSGRDFSIFLAKSGCKVIAAARRVDRLNSLCDMINSQSSLNTPRAVALELDVTAEPPAIEAAVQKAWSAFGHIDVLINNAGLRGSTSSAMKLTKEQWDHVLKVNLYGAWICSKYVALQMQAAKQGGSIINISSISGLNRVQSNGTVAYSSSKAGMHAMTTVMALDLGTHNIRVNTIAPSIFRSEITEELLNQKWLLGVVKKIVPLPYHESTVETAFIPLIRYLIDDSSKYVTGNIFVVDGGSSLAGVPVYSSL